MGETTDNEERTGQGPKGDFREVLFDLAKLMFTTMVLGEMLLLAKDIGDINNWGMLNIGILGTYLLARVGNRILK